jgi:hypothetical protein
MKPGPKPRTHGIDGHHTCVLGLQPDNIPLNCHTREVIEREKEREREVDRDRKRDLEGEGEREFIYTCGLICTQLAMK